MQQSAFRTRRIKFADLIAGVRVIPKSLIPVGKTFRYIKRSLVLLVQFDRNVLKISGAFRPQVDNDIENCAAGAAHQLCLRGRRELKMHSPQGPFLDVERDIGLRNGWFQAVRCELLLAKGASEKPPRILPAFEIDEKGSFKLRFGKYHVTSLG